MENLQKSILIAGAVSALLLFGGFLLVYVSGYDPIAYKTMYYWIPAPILIHSIRVLKDDSYDGMMPYKAGVKHGIMVTTVYSVLFALGLYVICKVAEPPFIEQFGQQIAERMEQEKVGVPDDIVKEQIDSVTSFFMNNILGFVAFSELISKFIFGAIVSLIASFVFRKRDQPTVE